MVELSRAIVHVRPLRGNLWLALSSGPAAMSGHEIAPRPSRLAFVFAVVLVHWFLQRQAQRLSARAREMFSALSSYAMRVCAQLKCVNSAMFDRLRDAKKVSASNASE